MKNMRDGLNAASGNRKRAQGIARLMVFAICFVAVFAAALAFGDGALSAIVPGAGIGNNIAEANVSSAMNNDFLNKFTPAEQTGSQTFEITEKFDNLKSSDFSGTQSTDIKWSVVSFANAQDFVVGLNGDARAVFGGNWGCMFNYDLPTAIKNILSTDLAEANGSTYLFTVKVKFTCHTANSGNANLGNVKVGIKEGAYSGAPNYDGVTGDGTTGGIDGGKNGRDISQEFTLNRNVTTIGVGFGAKFTAGISNPCTRLLHVTDMQMVITVTMNESFRSNNSMPTLSSKSVSPSNRTSTVTASTDPSTLRFFSPDPTIVAELNKNKDSLASSIYHNGVVHMTSYENTFISGTTYYKTASLTFTSSYGLKRLTAGSASTSSGAYADIFKQIAKGGTADKTFTTDLKDSSNRTVGSAKITITNRTNVKIDLYFTANAPYDAATGTGGIVVEFSTYGTGSNDIFKVTFDVRGIDNKAPTNNVRLTNNLVKTDASALTDWWRTGNFDPSSSDGVDATSDAMYSPSAWFYYVQRGDSLDALTGFSSKSYNDIYDLVKAGTITPFSLATADDNSFDPFLFNFDTGFAKGLTDSDNAANYSAKGNSAVQKGYGYYRFDFYRFDFAGNMAADIKTFFVKYDGSTLLYDFDMKYNDEVSGGGQINYTSDMNAQKTWMTGAPTITISPLINYAGNLLVFAINGTVFGIQASVTMGEGGVWNVSFRSFQDNLESAAAITGDTASFIFTDAVGQARQSVSVKLEQTRGGQTTDTTVTQPIWKFTLTFPNINSDTNVLVFDTTFKWVHDSSSLPSNYNSREAYVKDGWGAKTDANSTGGTHIYVDKARPNVPELSDNDGKLQSTSEYTRDWFTKYELSATMGFYDFMLEHTQYGGNDITTYTLVKYLDTVEGLTNLLTWLSTNGKFFQSDDLAQGIFDSFDYFNDTDTQVTSKSSLGRSQSQTYPLTVDLIEGKDVGARIVLTWTKDQAGLYSDSYRAYIIFVDGNEYTVAGQLLEQSAIADTSSSVSAGGSARYKRGDEVTLTVNIADGFVPYKLYINQAFGVDGAELKTNIVFQNFTAKTQWTVTDGYKTYASSTPFADGTATVTISLEDSENLGALGDASKTVTFILSRRQVVSRYSFQTTNVTYNREAQAPVLFYDGNNATNIRNAFVTELHVRKTSDGEISGKAEQDSTGKYTEATTGTPLEIKYTCNYHEIYCYVVYYFIPMDDPDFVTENMTVGEDGNQVVADADKVNFFVNPQTIELAAIEGSSDYGFIIKAEDLQFVKDDAYETAFKGEPDGYPTVTLKLDNSAWASGSTGANRLQAGAYNIVLDSYTSANYIITVTSAKYTVNQKNITVYALNSSKTYGDNDIERYRFGVLKSVIDEMTTGPKAPQYGERVSDAVTAILAELFVSTTYGVVDSNVSGLESYYVYTINRSNTAALKRAEETVNNAGSYAYEINSNGFGTRTNYILTPELSSGQYTINKRDVTLSVASEEYLNYGETPDPTTAKPSVNVEDNVKDGHLLSEIRSIVEDLLKLTDGGKESDHSDEYSEVYKYLIQFVVGEAKSNTYNENDNYNFTLAEGSYYFFYIAQGDSIYITFSDANLQFDFGTEWTNDTIKYEDAELKTKFVAERADKEPMTVQFDDIKWTVTLERVSYTNDKYPNAGSYVARFSDVHLMKDGKQLVSRQENKETNDGFTNVYVNSFEVVFNPAKITIKAKYAKLDKVYGEEDSVYGIDFDIATVNGEEWGEEKTLAGWDYATLKSKVNARFVRAIYNDRGFVREGEQFDNATNVDKYDVYNTNQYYRLIKTVANIPDNNLTYVEGEDELDDTVRFVITPKDITLQVKNFQGVIKVYDGTNEVNFNDVIAYDLMGDENDVRVQPTDEILLSYSAVYVDKDDAKEPTGGAGVPHISTDVGIKFTELALSGSSALNYNLKDIVNSLVGTAAGSHLKTGEEAADAEKDTHVNFEGNDIIVIIFLYKDGSSIENIVIMPLKLGVTLEDFTITRVYDATTGLAITDIDFAVERRADLETGSGNFILYEAFNASKGLPSDEKYVFLVDSEGSTERLATAFNNHHVGSKQVAFTLRFYVEHALDFLPIDATDNVKYNKGTDDKGDYFEVIISGMPATITQYNITSDDFAAGSFTAVDREYNADTEVELRYQFNERVPDDYNTVGLSLYGNSASKDVGTHAVIINSEYDLKNTDYSVDIEGISTYFREEELSVTITKARLVLNAQFKDRQYDGLKNVDVVWNGDENTVTTANFAELETTVQEKLREELALMSVSYKEIALSKDGQINFDVAFDENSNVIPHNVIFYDLTVTSSDGDKADLNNYTLQGSVYVGEAYADVIGHEDEYLTYNSTEKATQITVNNAQPSGDTAFELIASYDEATSAWTGPLTISQRAFNIFEDSIHVPEKVYDGSENIDVTIDIPANSEEDGLFFVAEVDRPYLAIASSAYLTNRNVGTNVPVRFRQIPELVYQAPEGVEATRTEDILKNYVRLTYNNVLYTNVLARPVEVKVDVADKEYDGISTILPNQITYTFEYKHYVMGEEDHYMMRAVNGAYYLSKNVAFDRDGAVTEQKGALFNPEFRNTKTGFVNYTPVYSSSVKEDGYIAYKEGEDGALVYYTEYAGASADVTYYYPLKTTDKYIETTDYEEYKDYVVASYVYDGRNVYVVRDDAEGAKVNTFSNVNDRLTYIEVSSKIEQKEVRLDPSALTIINPTTLIRPYDGTNMYYGVQDVDFKYDSSAIRGYIEGDDVSVELLSAVFNSTGTDATAVIFTIKALRGSDKGNYKVNDATSNMATQEMGRIEKRDIVASLADGEMEYGTVLNGSSLTVTDSEITYYLGSPEYPVYVHNMAMYIKYADFEKAVFGDQPHQPIDAQRFKGDSLDSLTQDNDGEWMLLGGTLTSLPSATATFASSRPNAFDTSVSYLLAGGDAGYFNFTFAYTDAETSTSTMTVTQKHLFVSTDITTSEYTGVYGPGWAPSALLSFYDAENSLYDLAAWDSYNYVFVVDGVNYTPLVQWFVKDGGSWKKVGTGHGDIYPKLDTEYVAGITLPTGWESVYKLGNPLYNYYFHFGTKLNQGHSETDYSKLDYDIVTGDEGKYYLQYHCNGHDYNVATSTLRLERPDGSDFGVSVPQTEYTFEYNGENPLPTMVLGSLATDDISIVLAKAVSGGYEPDRDAQGTEKIVTTFNAGRYVGYVRLVRPIVIDSNDRNNYVAEWRSAAVVTLNINKAELQLAASSESNAYGMEQSYDLSKLLSYRKDIAELASGITLDMFTVVITDADGNQIDATAFRTANAGTYTVTITLNEKFEEKFFDIAAGKVNYVTRVGDDPQDLSNDRRPFVSVSATYTVSKANIEITFLAGDDSNVKADGVQNGVRRFVGRYMEGSDYYVDFNARLVNTAVRGYAQLPDKSSPDFDVWFSQVFMRENISGATDINAPGKYSFRVVLDDAHAANYVLSGADGLLELYASQINVSSEQNAGNGEAELACEVQVMGDDTKVVANRLVVHAVTNEGTIADNQVYNTIRGFMPGINKNARVASILQVSLYYDNKIVNTNGVQLKVSIEVPADIDSNLENVAVYAQNASGDLEKLKYELKDGAIEYTTTYLGVIVFVDIASPTLPSWLMWTIVGVGAAVALFCVWVLASFIIRKSKLKKLNRK